ALHGWRDVVGGAGDADDFLVERETRAARKRLDVEHHVAELAVAARLFLVPAAHRADRLADGLAVADARRVPLDRDAVAVGEPLGGDAQVHLALAPDDDPVRLRIVVHPLPGILSQDL